MKELSPYARVYPYDDSHIMLFDTVDKSIIKIDSSWIGENKTIDDDAAGAEAMETLKRLGFFRTATEGRELAQAKMSDPGRLSISVEVSLGCNLRCPYCYQGDSKKAKLISPESLAHLEGYVAEKVDGGELREVVIKVLGGEPSIVWDVVDPTLRRIAATCDGRVRFTLMVDTNGVYVKPFESLDYADRYIFTVPLTHRDCHDKMRFDATGHGTYDRVVDGVSCLMTIPNAIVVLRHNTDADNAVRFPEYLDDIKDRFPFAPLIDISYTASFDNTGYENPLSYSDYLQWRLNSAMPELIKRELPVLIAPVMSQKPCQRLGAGSMKLFSDDTVGYCALDFFESQRKPFVSLDSGSFESEREALPPACSECDSFFVCGGSYMLPCIKKLGYETCEEDGAFNVDLEGFLRLYLDTGNPGLFPVFNQTLVVR